MTNWKQITLKILVLYFDSITKLEDFDLNNTLINLKYKTIEKDLYQSPKNNDNKFLHKL